MIWKLSVDITIIVTIVTPCDNYTNKQINKQKGRYGAWMISRHIFSLGTGQNGFSKTAIAQSFWKNKINPS